MKDYNMYEEYPVVEEYMTDPATEKNPEKWLTRITYYFSE
jgi:effector-binding domain-containing protein